MSTYIYFLLFCVSLTFVMVLIMLNSFQDNQDISARDVLPDERNIPWVDYSDRLGNDTNASTFYRNPLTIARYADKYYTWFINSNDSKNREAFLNNVNWLVENMIHMKKDQQDYALLIYQFPLPTYNLTPPWISGMAHGQSLPSLLNAYDLTNNSTYINAAKLLLHSFNITTQEGGPTLKSPSHGWWYEEVSGPGAPSNGSRILNGMMYTILGIYDYYNKTYDQNAKYLFEKGIVALKNGLPNYDFNGTWSTYDVIQTSPAPANYHELHVQLLDELYQITGETIFKNYSDKWNQSSSEG